MLFPMIVKLFAFLVHTLIPVPRFLEVDNLLKIRCIKNSSCRAAKHWMHTHFSASNYREVRASPSPFITAASWGSAGDSERGEETRAFVYVWLNPGNFGPIRARVDPITECKNESSSETYLREAQHLLWRWRNETLWNMFLFRTLSRIFIFIWILALDSLCQDVVRRCKHQCEVEMVGFWAFLGMYSHAISSACCLSTSIDTPYSSLKHAQSAAYLSMIKRRLWLRLIEWNKCLKFSPVGGLGHSRFDSNWTEMDQWTDEAHDMHGCLIIVVYIVFETKLACLHPFKIKGC